MPLVGRDPGGWMSPRNQPKPAPSRRILSARSEPVRHPTIAATGFPAMDHTRTSLIGLQ